MFSSNGWQACRHLSAISLKVPTNGVRTCWKYEDKATLDEQPDGALDLFSPCEYELIPNLL